MGCTNRPQEEDLFVDMNWAIEKRSGMIQLLSVIPEKTLYEETHGAGEVGKDLDQPSYCLIKIY